MDTTNLILGISNISVGILLILISIPLLMKTIERNHVYGFRIAKAFKSEENWYNINAYWAKYMIIWSIPIILIGIICFFIPIDDQSALPLPLILGAGPIIVFVFTAIIQTLIYAKRL